MIDVEKATRAELEEYYEAHVADDWCGVCKYNYDCEGGVRSGAGGEPIYPPCADGDIPINEDVLADAVREHLEVEK